MIHGTYFLISAAHWVWGHLEAALASEVTKKIAAGQEDKFPLVSLLCHFWRVPILAPFSFNRQFHFLLDLIFRPRPRGDYFKTDCIAYRIK